MMDSSGRGRLAFSTDDRPEPRARMLVVEGEGEGNKGGRGGHRRAGYRGQERGRTGVEGAHAGAFDRCRLTVPVFAAMSGRLDQNERERSIHDTAGRHSPPPRHHQDAGFRA